MRLGDLDALKAILFNDTQYGFWHDSMDGSDVAYTQRDIFKCIDAMPTIDAIPVVRCKDCKHYYRPLQWPVEYTKGLCNVDLFERRVHPDDFCSYGERKEDEG